MPHDQTPIVEPKQPRRHDLRRKLPPRLPRPHSAHGREWLVVVDAPRQYISRFDADHEIRIGRHIPGTAIRWNNVDLGRDDNLRSVSRRHCCLYYHDGTFWIEDLGSTNGTWHQGIRIEPHSRIAIASRDYVFVGNVGLWVFLPLDMGG